MTRNVKMRIYGRVQGVGFRYSAQAKARALNIRGLAKNMPDGSVYIEAGGDNSDVEVFIEWCHHGPPLARIDDVKIEECQEISQSSFITG